MSGHTQITPKVSDALKLAVLIDQLEQEPLATATQLEEIRAKLQALGGSSMAESALVETHSRVSRPIYFLEELTPAEAFEWMTNLDWILRCVAADRAQ